MGQTTKGIAGSPAVVADFYDELASDYDVMTGFEKRFVQEKPFFRVLAERFRIGSALDAGTGSGFHALLLAQLGIAVTAVDVSRSMLERLRSHARQMELSVEVVQSSFQELDRRIRKKFDAVFCLGNSLPHVLTDEELEKSVRNFALLLNPDGILFLQSLNYDRILARKERIQSVKVSQGKTFVRFYDYQNDRISFNILTLTQTNGGVESRLRTVDLRPLLSDQLISLLEKAGFRTIKRFGSIAMDDYLPETSKDLVVLATQSPG